MATFYDTHAHLDYPGLAERLSEVIAHARQAGIGRILNVGTDLENSQAVVRTAGQHPDVYAAVGWHPNHADTAPADLKTPLRELARNPKVLAIGETGLDYYRLPTSKKEAARAEASKRRQAEAFQQQLELAAELGLGCIVHQRKSLDDTLAMIRPWQGKVSCVFHCFTEDPAALERVLEAGAMVSFTGIATFENGQNVRDVVALTPLDRMMLETDAPYLPPLPYDRRGRCEPAYLVETAQVIARVKGITLEELSEATCANARRFFWKETGAKP